MLTALFAAFAAALGLMAPVAPAVIVASPNTATLKGGLGLGDPRTMLPQLCPCTDLNYQRNYTSQQQLYAGATQQLSAWIVTHPDGTVVGFSQGASVAIEAANRHPGTRFLFLGSPDTPSNVDPAWVEQRRRNGLPRPPITANQTYIVRQYDSVADKPYDTTNKLAMQNLSINTHLYGYKNVNLNDPRNVVVIDPVTGHKTIYLPSDVLPMLQSRDWYTSDAKMRELDALYRPQIDAAYTNNPGRPVIPAGPNRSTPSVTMNSTEAQTVVSERTGPPATVAAQSTEQSSSGTQTVAASRLAANGATTPSPSPTPSTTTTRDSVNTSVVTKREQRKADRAAARAERKAERETRKAEKDADKTADNTESGVE